ncbi:MAG: hypothetical protein AB7U59_14920 [Desulfovibrionaceae bacterium]
MNDPFKGVEVFRAGDHVDSAGRPHTFTEVDLDRIAAYDPARHEAPLVIGHPEHNAPAYGWVDRVYREGAVLKADFKDVAPEFADLVKAGRFKKRSISLYPGGDLRHVGFLGAVPPAIKGLKDVQFAEGEASTFEFGEPSQDPEKSFFARFADFLGLSLPHNDKPAGSPAFKEAPVLRDDPLTIEVETLKAKMGEFAEELRIKDGLIQNLKSANEKLANRVDATVATGRRGEIARFCEGLADTGQLTDFQRGLAVDFMERLDGAGTMDFAEGDKTVKKPVTDVFKAFLESLPVQVEFGEIATHSRAAGKTGDLDVNTLAKKIRDKVDAAVAAGHTMSFAEAQAEVMREQEGTRK